MTKHTPGPWTVGANNDYGLSVEGIHGVQVAWCGLNSTYQASGHHIISLEEALANAHLIAAARDLLGELQRAVARKSQGYRTTEAEWAQIRAVIAKAEGAP